MKNCKGLSLIEILVALIITGIIAACVSAAVLGGYYMLKQAEHKSRAMSIAHVKLQEYLSKSFDELKEGSKSGDEGDISQAFIDTQDNTFFNWTVDVTSAYTAGLKIPYKNVIVNSTYTETNTKGQAASCKTLRLSNMVVYPLIHITSDGRKYTRDKAKDYEAPCTDGPYNSTWVPSDYKWKDITLVDSGVLSINYAVPKDLIVMYNLAVTYDMAHPPSTTDTTFTRCIIDDEVKESGIITRTPIMTQVFINNILEIDNVAAGPHKIRIQWSHDYNNPEQTPLPTPTSVWLREYHVTVVAVEHTDKTVEQLP